MPADFQSWPLITMVSVAVVFMTWVIRMRSSGRPPNLFVMLFFGGQIVWFTIDAAMMSSGSWYHAHLGDARIVYICQFLYVLCLLPFSSRQAAAAKRP